MFGYVNVYKPELKMKDYYKYKAYYCGLCDVLKNKYGRAGQMTLSYDMTFLIILLSSLYETNTVKEQKRCVIHPLKVHDLLRNEITEYVADMEIALSYHHLKDDWMDEKSITGYAGAKLLKKKYNKVERQYPRQCRRISECLKQLQDIEKQCEINIDMVSRCFGELMSEIFVYRQDVWESTLRKLGFYLGKFIYILDAYDDLEKDHRKRNYNPLHHIEQASSFDEDCYQMLTMMMAECTKEFEKLPCLIDLDILHNILYEGVWTKYDTIRKNRLEKEGTKV